MADAIRWTISVSSETDLSLRGFLGAQGMKKGDLSKFVEDAVRWRMLDRTVQAVKERNQDMSADLLEAMIDEAVREVRAERRKQTAQH
ncbi:ribbon-helix-helix domain-containing protein [Thiothrix lacustris]|uniref:ribbon-helix-helix domain-containing protein n=1 Tax=Thiothrix lacustris TaxID=525917 RepID=UPI000491C7A9|nr:ribbon-helix-helix domain-containing protein [Thiothrix lacustris]WMP18203.1 ribbon-helix-helix domain-containing protein [Thiothrix lacustris]